MILNETEINAIKSMADYWHEVRRREGETPHEILAQELNQAVGMFGTKILWILEAYAKGISNGLF